MVFPKFLSIREIPEIITIQNPGGRSYTVEESKSGYKRKQTFTSKCFPKCIVGKYIGLSRYIDGKIHPSYMLEATKKTLRLKGHKGFDNGPDIMHEICQVLLAQEELLVARSITKNDIDKISFDYKLRPRYWLASCERKGSSDYTTRFVIHYVDCYCEDTLTLVYPSGNEGSGNNYIRPVITLETEITDFKEENESLLI